MKHVKGIFAKEGLVVELRIPEYYNMTQDIDRHAADRNKVAIRWENERGDKRTLTYHELKAHSDALARGCSRRG